MGVKAWGMSNVGIVNGVVTELERGTEGARNVRRDKRVERCEGKAIQDIGTLELREERA